MTDPSPVVTLASAAVSEKFLVRLLDMVRAGLSIHFAEYIARQRGKALTISAAIEAESVVKATQTLSNAGLSVGPAVLPSLALTVERSAVEQEERQLRNAAKIIDKAVPLLQADNPAAEIDAAEPDPDWATRFFDATRTVSGPEMQTVWARLLASEVRAPGTVSIRTLEVVRTLSRADAEAFQRLCSVCVAPAFAVRDSEPVNLGDGSIHVDPRSPELTEIYVELQLLRDTYALHEAGLVHAEFPFSQRITFDPGVSVLVESETRIWSLSLDPGIAEPMILEVPAFVLTKVGVELSQSLSIPLRDDVAAHVLGAFGATFVDVSWSPRKTM